MRKRYLYNTWVNMKQRCYNINASHYPDYGGRGISVCDVWIVSYKLFEEWSLLNGYKPELSLDRINSNGNYCPDNCRWATDEDQANNKRNIKKYLYDGEFLSLAQICRREGLNKSKIWDRISRRGMTIYEAIEIGDKRKPYIRSKDSLKRRCEQSGLNYNAVKIRKSKYNISEKEAMSFYVV